MSRPRSRWRHKPAGDWYKSAFWLSRRAGQLRAEPLCRSYLAKVVVLSPLTCRLSVRMFNLLLSDCGCPRMLSFLPDRVTGLLKIRISEHPYSYCDQLGALLGFPENRSPAFWTKVECHSSTAICSTHVSFGDALTEPDLLSRIECLNTESAARTALAFEAVAHGDADGVASNRYLELSATACGFAIRHVDYLSTETHN